VRLGPGGTDWLPVEAGARPTEPVHFVIAAPGYRHDSGGIVALHRLCDVLNRLGHLAVLLPLDGNTATVPGWHTPVVADASAADGAVVVYPEIVPGNPLGGSRVVRWLLNRPGHITGRPLDAEPGDLLVVWNGAIDTALPVLTLPLLDPGVFFPKDARGRGGLLWVGKGRLPTALPRAGTTMITRTWPATRPELAALLRGADVLYSCDWMTAMVFESLLCGTPVVLVGDQQWRRDELVDHGIVKPGMIFEDGDLDAAREAVPAAWPEYREQVAGAAASVAGFVALAQRHFGLGDRADEPVAAVAVQR